LIDARDAALDELPQLLASGQSTAPRAHLVLDRLAAPGRRRGRLDTRANRTGVRFIRRAMYFSPALADKCSMRPLIGVTTSEPQRGEPATRSL